MSLRDKRPVDELSIEELEQILRLKRREARVQRFKGGNKRRERIDVATPVPVAPPSRPTPPTPPQAQPAVQVPSPQSVELEPGPPDDGGIPQFEADLTPRDYPAVMGYDAPSAGNDGGNLASKFFLLVEVGAIVGLIALIYVAYQGITQVNANIDETNRLTATSEAELAAQRIQPTATPLIAINQVVLPGGHIWDENGQHQFNFSEVPAPYRPIFQEQLSAPRSQVAFQVPEGGPIRVEVPKLNIDAGVRSGDDWITLQAGVGHQPFSGNPGERGNMVLTAHNDIYGEIFKRIDELSAGDEIRVQSSTGQWYTYIVREKQQVEPTEVWVLDQNLGQQTPIVTLITCYPYRVNTHRMIVFAELLSES